jgi:hypothetical protein
VTQARRNALESLAFWGIPPLIALFIYWPALRAWFQGDDFVWLNLLPRVHSWSDFWNALFQPSVQGTWRPLGERGYFLSLQWLFGYSSGLPFRMVAFLIQFANMALISAIVARLTRSRVAAFLAPVLWIASDKLALTMVWGSSINYAVCGFFVLSALWFLVRHVETHRRGYLIAMWLAFILGLGSLEMAVAFPAMAAIYTLACARPCFKKTIPLLAAAAVFGIAHQILAPNKAGGMYSMHFDGAIVGTLAAYWKMALKPDHLSIFTPLPEIAGTAGIVLFNIALLGYAACQALRRNFVPLVFLTWFLVLLSPVLPLRDHIFDYYLMLPLIGLAMLAADAFARAWSGRIVWRFAGGVLVGFFLFESALVARKSSWSWSYRSWNIRAMVMGVAEAHRLHPDRTVLLKDIDDMLFWGAVSQRCFLFLGFDNVYLAPGSELQITPHVELGDVNSFVMPAASVRKNLSDGRLSVLAWKRDHLEDVTRQYEAPVSDSSPVLSSQADRLDVGDPRNADHLDDAWYPIDQGFRWMPKRASVRIRISGDRAQTLHLSGYCPGAAVQKGAVHLIVSVNGAAFHAVSIDKGDAPFEIDFPLRPGLPKEIEVTLEVDRTFTSPPDIRELGLAFGVVEIR